MTDTREVTTKRSKHTSDTASTGAEVRPDEVGSVAEEFKLVDWSCLDILGDWIRCIVDVLGELDLGDIGFDW